MAGTPKTIKELDEMRSRAQIEAAKRYRVEGTTDSEWGEPLFRAPGFLIDTSTAEPEVNWPGELVAEYDNPQDAHDHRQRLIARAIREADEAAPEGE